VLACTATKRADPDPLPALRRYDGPSFRTLRKWQATNPAAAENLDILILSAKLGLIADDALISDYNQRMTPARATELREAASAALTHFLAQHGPYTATLVHLGQDYEPAIAPTLLPAPTLGVVTHTVGGIGTRLGQLKAWLVTIIATVPAAGAQTIQSRSSEAPVTVQCKGCGQMWPRDPILEVACPTCHARIGHRCKRPSGHDATDYHSARDLLAMERVPGYGRCPAAHPPAVASLSTQRPHTQRPTATPPAAGQLALHL
jgi:hypothetical protein